jgi:hypothetical protein
MIEDGDAINSTYGTNAAVALQHTLPQMTWITTEPPFFYAPIRTEGPAAGWNFQVAPAAKTAAVFAALNRIASSAAARHCALRAHPGLLTFKFDCLNWSSTWTWKPAAKALV